MYHFSRHATACDSSRQRKSVQCVGNIFAEISAAASGNHHKLLASIPAVKSHGGCESTRLEPGFPRTFPCVSVKRPETAVTRPADKNQATRSHHCATEIRSAGLRHPAGLKFIHHSQRHPPGKLARI